MEKLLDIVIELCEQIHSYNNEYNNKTYREKSITLCGVQHSVTMADFIMPKTQQPTILSCYFDYLLSLPFKASCITSEIYIFLVE